MRGAEHLEADQARMDRIWRQRLERSGIYVESARRHHLAEPENRLLVRQPEEE